MMKFLSLSLLFLWAFVPSARAIILYSTADANANTSAPSGVLEGSGWQWQGQWGDFLGTAIAPNYFITAAHVGGAVGQTFTLNSVSYPTTAFFDDPNSDLRIWQVSGTFGSYAPLYLGSSEAGEQAMLFGRGTQRGAEVLVSSTLKGWQYGSADHVQRWGQNQIVESFDGGVGIGNLLRATFDAGGGANEAHLSTGDSGGGLFIDDGGVWKLAGIHYAVEGPYNTSTTGAGFLAAIFDEGGLYEGGEGSWSLNQDVGPDRPGSLYSTQISANSSWILAVVPEPSHGGLAMGAVLLAFAAGCARRRRFRRSEARPSRPVVTAES